MKKFTLLFFIFTSMITSVNAQELTDWKWIHRTPQGNNLTWIKMWDANNWYIVGGLGTFMKTSNAGADWYFHHKAGVEFDNRGSYGNLNTAWFFDMMTGVVVGQVTSGDNFARTTDGGITWVPCPVTGTTGNASWNDIYFINNNTGFAAGSAPGRFAKTTDGGISWEAAGASIPTLPSTTYNGIYAWNADNIIIVGNVLSGSNVRKSTDGGATWAAYSAGTTALQKVKFMSADTGFAVGASGNVSLTTNGGENWTLTPTGNTSLYRDIIFKGSELYVIGNSSIIFKSTDLGANWTEVPFLAPDQPFTAVPNSIDFTGDTLVIVGNTGQINMSTNSGGSWNTFTGTIKTGSINGVYALTGEGNVWTVGAPSSAGVTFDQVIFSSNGGANWIIQPVTGSTATFNSISMVNPSTGYIGGTTGRVRRTNDGGNTWDSVSTGITFNINSINFPDINTGWIFGATLGNIQKTTDGGVTWNPQTAAGVTGAINASAFIDVNTGWLAGASGRVSKTTNGGINWVAMTTDYTGTINEISMVNESTGYFVGTTSALVNMKKTTDGGESWTIVETPAVATLSGVNFVDALTGFIVSNTNGYTARTTDGGISWDIQNTGGSSNNDVYMVHSDTAFVVGGSAEMHKYALDGPPPVNPNFGSNNQVGDNLYFFANSSPGATGAPSQPEFIWKDTTGSINLYADGFNQATGFFTGDNDNGRWNLISQLGSGTIRFFGTDYTDVYIGTNGITGFNAFNPAFSDPPSSGLNQADITEAVFPLWIDLNAGYTGVPGRRISYKVTGSELIITYDRIPVYAPSLLTNDPDRYVSFQVIIEFSNASPTQNSRIFISYNYDETGSLFKSEYNASTLRTHLAGIQKNNSPDQFFQYRFSDASTVITHGPLFSSNLTLAMGPDENALPVELSSFTATVVKQDVYLNWTTVSEVNNAGFDVERTLVRSENTHGEWTKVGSVEGNGTTNQSQNYAFTDCGLNTGRYSYRLKQIDYNGNFEYFNLSNEIIIGVPDRYDLSQNYPNPFNPVTKINFELPYDSKVTMKIFDITGREVAVLVNEIQKAGYYTVTFDAGKIASGVYFYRLFAESAAGTGGKKFIMTKKLVVVK